MTITSYAQNFEDVMLWRALGKIEKGFYIDIGAQDPVIDSVSLAFYEHGWRGIHVEPVAHYAELLRQHRPGDTVIQAAVGEGSDVLKFFEIADSGISTADPSIAQQHRERGFDVSEITVPCIMLSSIFELCAGKEIHWLKIDVEGYEKQVLSGWGDSVARPWIVVVESTRPLTQIETHKRWQSRLLGLGYARVYFDGLNQYYVSKSHLELKSAFLTPPNVFDGFTLNGTASSTYHQLIKERFEKQIRETDGKFEQQKQAAKTEIERMTQRVKESDDRLLAVQQQAEQDKNEQARRYSEQALVISSEHAKREQVLSEEISRKQKEQEDLLRTLTQREQEFSAQLLTIQQQTEQDKTSLMQIHREQMRVLNSEHAQREQALSEQTGHARKELETLSLKLTQREREFETQIMAIQQEALKERSEREQRHNDQLLSLRREHTEREQALARQVGAVQEDLRNLERDRAGREQVLAEQSNQARRDLEDLLRKLAQREQEFGAQLIAIQRASGQEKADLARNYSKLENALRHELALREQVLTEQVSHARREIEDLKRTLAQRTQELTAQLAAVQKASEQEKSELMRNYAMLDSALRQELAVREQLLTEQAGHARQEMENLRHELVQREQALRNEIAGFQHKIQSPYDASQSVSRLDDILSWHDQQFIRCAYWTLLDREPDPEGLRYYTQRLHAGISKLQILAQIRYSTEGKERIITVPGLDKAIRRYRRAQYPLAGWIIRLFTGIESNSATERKLRSIERQLIVRMDENIHTFNKTTTILAELNHVIAQRTQAMSENKLSRFGEESRRRLSQIETVLATLRQMGAQQTQTIISERASIVPSGQSDSAITSRKQAEVIFRNEVSSPENKLLTHPDFQIAPTTPVVFPRPKGSRKIYYYVDHTILCPVNTGMQRVTRRLGRALLEAGEQIRYVKWDDSQCQIVLLNQDELACLAQWNGPALSSLHKEQYPVANASAVPVGTHVIDEGHWLVIPEVTHITYQSHPMTLEVLMAAKRLGLRTAFIFYDAIPLRRKEHSGMAQKHETYMQQLLLADLVVPISNWSARDLVSFFTVHEGAVLTPTPRVIAIPLPGESPLTQRVTETSMCDITHKLILTVGSIGPHKNQVSLVHAFERYCKTYPETEWQLALVGNLHPDAAMEIRRAVQQNSRIQYLEHIPDEQLDVLYRSCAFTVFPSIVEGFGLPILESLWYGKPCICANFGAMAEVAKDGGCHTIDTRNNDELLRAITLLTTKPEVLKKLSAEAVERTITTWNDYSQQFIARINEASEPLKQIGVIYYWVDHTSTYPANSGIQRVVRCLAKALVGIGLKVIPVKWDEVGCKFYPPTEDDLDHLDRWNGPQPSDWNSWIDPAQATASDWILIPELTTYLRRTSLVDVKKYASKCNMRVACIFHDAIPWKMRDLYPVEATKAHGKYMQELNEFELILPNSQCTRIDFISFLSEMPLKTPSLEYRIQASILPGEFLESERVTLIKSEVDSVTKILCVSTVEPRKNHLCLLRAFAQVVSLSQKPVELIIVGESPLPELAAQVRMYINTLPGIRWETSVSDARLRELYSECDFTVYPSLEEGFGLPILESLWYARPCICRNYGAMAEIAEGGGCLMVETAEPDALALAMLRMVDDFAYRYELAREAVNRPFKSWKNYAREVATRMSNERHIPLGQSLPSPMDNIEFYGQFVNLRPRPLLSICITTYNRAEWLSLSLENLARLLPISCAEIEIVVCDNTSEDHTPDVVQPYLCRHDFHYYRNPNNVGMLGNLRVTAHHARGEYIWILGDDDLIKPGSIEKVLRIIRSHPGIALIYLNYAYTRQDDAKAVTDLDKFLSEATPITTPVPDILGLVSRICTESENFFTAIYCLIFRRDHALRAYTQNTEGRPFSTMLTCIPTTYYVLNFMMSEVAYWVGDPQLVVNLNVSWMKYAPLWILERIPEVYDLAERMNAAPHSVDRWRNHNLPGIVHFFKEIYENDKESNMNYFSLFRLLGRIKHLEGFAVQAQALRKIYENAHTAGHPGAKIPPSQVFANFEKI